MAKQFPKASLREDGAVYRGPWIRFCNWLTLVVGWGQRGTIFTHWTLTFVLFKRECRGAFKFLVGGESGESRFGITIQVPYLLLINFFMHTCPGYPTAFSYNGQKAYKCPRCHFGKIHGTWHIDANGKPTTDSCLACAGSGFFLRGPNRSFVRMKPIQSSMGDTYMNLRHHYRTGGYDGKLESGFEFYIISRNPIFIQSLLSPQHSHHRPNWKEGHHWWTYNYFDLYDKLLGTWQLDRTVLHECRAEIPMPEGYYAVGLKIERWVRYRKHLWFWKSREIVCDMVDGCLPGPGKDGDDDGIYGMGVTIDNPLRAVAEGIEKLAKRGFESRQRYGGSNWRNWRPSPTHHHKPVRPPDY